MHRLPHFVRTDGADAADAEGLGLGQLAWVENKTFIADQVVKSLELVAAAVRRVHGDNDRRLDLGRQELNQSQFAHAGHQGVIVRRVTRQPRRLAAFREKLIQRLMEGNHDMRRRREAPLRGFFHVGPLVVQVQRE